MTLMLAQEVDQLAPVAKDRSSNPFKMAVLFKQLSYQINLTILSCIGETSYIISSNFYAWAHNSLSIYSTAQMAMKQSVTGSSPDKFLLHSVLFALSVDVAFDFRDFKR